MKTKAKRPTLYFAPEVQLSLLEEQSSFHVQWHEPMDERAWGPYIRRIFLLEVARKKNVKISEIKDHWPDLVWSRKGASTYRRWLHMAQRDFQKSPSHTKSHLRRLAHWHFRDHSTPEEK